MKKWISIALSALMALGLAACTAEQAAESAQTSEAVQQSEPAQEAQPEQTAAPRTTFRIAGLKGPTTMGMVKLMEDADMGDARHDYAVEMYGTADEIVPQLVTGELDVALVPANLAAVLNTRAEIEVAAINTLAFCTWWKRAKR